MGAWRNITARTPEVGSKAVLIWVPENRCIYCAVRGHAGWHIFGGGWREHIQRATHWQPLPDPPEPNKEMK